MCLCTAKSKVRSANSLKICFCTTKSKDRSANSLKLCFVRQYYSPTYFSTTLPLTWVQHVATLADASCRRKCSFRDLHIAHTMTRFKWVLIYEWERGLPIRRLIRTVICNARLTTIIHLQENFDKRDNL
jgi:hypothetical protein